MGIILDKPITTKTTERGGSADENGIRWGVSSMQGWRGSMEDEHIAQKFSIVEDPETGHSIELKEPHFFFAVLDGHGGSMAADYASKHLFQLVQRRPEFIKYAKSVAKATPDVENVLTDEGKSSDSNPTMEATSSSPRQQLTTEISDAASLLQRALEDAFVEMDLQLLKEKVNEGLLKLQPDPESLKATEPKNTGADDNNNNNNDDLGLELDRQGEEDTPAVKHSVLKSGDSGTTVTALLVTPDLMLCANVGDSRTIIDAFPLSTDHKPSLPLELQRIEKAHGNVTNDRVEGELAVSRALGDFDFKDYNQSHITEGIMDINEKRAHAEKLKVTPFPEVTVHYRTDIDQAIILACDGVWDVMSNIECNEFVQTRCEQGQSDVGLIAEQILNACLEKGSKDNMTVLVGLLPAQEIGNDGGVVKRRRYKETIDLCK